VKIEDLLREAGQNDRSLSCAPEVEKRLRSAFRSRRPLVWGVLAGAIAAVLALALWLVPRRETQPPPPPETPVATVKEVPQVVEPPAITKQRSVRPKRKMRPREVEVLTDFFALDAAALNGVPDGYVMRVQVPRATMASFGLPVNQAPDQHIDAQRVDADLLMGSNGTARAIRFVRYVPVIQ
jgi:hypothetical protein